MEADHKVLILEVSIPGNPIGFSRPRFNRKTGKVWNTPSSMEYRDIVVAEFLAAARYERNSPDLFAVHAAFYRSNRQRIDLDNLLKMVLDAGTQAHVWDDDSQVREVWATKAIGVPDPRVDISIYRLAPSDTPRKLCLHCSKPCRRDYPSSQSAGYCSIDCWRKSRRTTMACENCSGIFEISKSMAKLHKRKYCSRACGIEGCKVIGQVVGKESDKWVCLVCGGQVSRKEYTICRPCSMQKKKNPTSNYWKLRHAIQVLD